MAKNFQNTNAFGLYVPLFSFLFCLFKYQTIIPHSDFGIVHVVPQQYVGYRMTFSALDNYTYPPGWHLKCPWPFVTGHITQVTVQTDTVDNIKVTTKDRVELTFPSIEIGNTLDHKMVIPTIANFGPDYDVYLVKDKIRHQLNVIASDMTSGEVTITRFSELDDILKNFLVESNLNETNSGVKIEFVRIPRKPTFRKDLQVIFDGVANEKAKQMVADQEKVTAQKVHERDMISANGRIEILAMEANATRMRLIANMEANETISVIQSSIDILREETYANNTLYRMNKEAEGNAALLTPAYLKWSEIRAVTNNSKHYFGKIPRTFFEGGNVCPSQGVISNTAN